MKDVFYNIFSELTAVRSWDEFVFFFTNQSLAVQLILGFGIFGALYLVFLFFAAMWMSEG